MRDKLNQLFKSEKSQCSINSSDSIEKGKKKEKTEKTNRNEKEEKQKYEKKMDDGFDDFGYLSGFWLKKWLRPMNAWAKSYQLAEKGLALAMKKWTLLVPRQNIWIFQEIFPFGGHNMDENVKLSWPDTKKRVILMRFKLNDVFVFLFLKSAFILSCPFFLVYNAW